MTMRNYGHTVYLKRLESDYITLQVDKLQFENSLPSPAFICTDNYLIYVLKKKRVNNNVL